MIKKSFLITALIFLIIGIGAVNAEDVTQTSDIMETVDSDMDILSNNQPKSFRDLSDDIDKSPNDRIDIESDYKFNNVTDGNYKDGKTITISETGTYTINGNNHVIDANNQAGIFKFNNGAVVINNLKICNSHISSIILNNCELRTNNVTFENNYDSTGGGAVFSYQSNYYSNNDKFINNYAINGASVYGTNSIIDIKDSTFTNNKIHWSLIYGFNSKMTISNTVFANMTSRYATAIFLEEADLNSILTVSNCKFINLRANATAGAIGVKGVASMTIDGCTFINVTSAKNAGAIYADLNGNQVMANNIATIKNSLFENCSSNFAGAYLQLGGKLNMAKTNFINNSAVYSGGAVFLSNTTTLIGTSKFDKNTAQTKGGALFIDDSDAIINNVEFTNNVGEGNAIYLTDSKYDVKNSKFTKGNGETVVSFFDRKGSSFNSNNQLNGGKTLLNQEIYKTVVDYEGNKIVLIENPITNASAKDSKFDLRNYQMTINGRKVSLAGIVKDQGNNGACWAFGATGALESAFLKATGILLNLSENNIQGAATHYNEYGTDYIKESGFATSGMGLFLSWLGVVPAEYDQYDELGKISLAFYTNESYHIHDAIIIPKRTSSTDNDKLKEALVNYGGLTVHVYGAIANNNFYNKETHSQYYNGKDYGNHFVTLVGWDDNYPKEKFTIRPEGNGAWICKNSWGSEWGENGYYYISYYDTAFAKFSESVGYIIKNTENYNMIYQYDIGDIERYYKENGAEFRYVNTFEAENNELIKAVGTYFENPNEEYTIKVYVNNALKYTQKGKSTHGGFETIKLDKQIIVNEGQKFSVEIQAKAVPVFENTRLHFDKGNSVVYYPDNTMDDLAKFGKCACLKVYTTKTNISGNDNTKYYSKNNLTIASEANGKTINITDSNGKVLGSAIVKDQKASFNISLEPGSYCIDYGDFLEGFEIMNSIEVDDNIKIGYLTQLILDVKFYDEDGVELFGNEITYTLDGKQLTKTIDEYDGTIYIDLSKLSIGKHTLIFKNPETQEESVTNIEVVSRFGGNSNVNMFYNDGSSFKVRVYGDDGNPVGANQIVTIKLNKATYNVKTNSNGYAILKIPDSVKPNTYSLTASYKGQTIKNTVKVKQVMKLSKAKVKKSSKKLVIKATLKGKTPIKNKKVTFKFNGKTYKARTNSKGIAKITIKKSVLKKLKVGKKVKYQVTYAKLTVKQSVKVRK